jgi:hypothetical protein
MGADPKPSQYRQPNVLHVVERRTVRQMRAALQQHFAAARGHRQRQKDGLQHKAGTSGAATRPRGRDVECLLP